MIGSRGCEGWAGSRSFCRRVEDLRLADDAVLIVAADDENLAVLQQSRGMAAARAVQLAGAEDLGLANRTEKHTGQKDDDGSDETPLVDRRRSCG